jgi:hypothetical protein
MNTPSGELKLGVSRLFRRYEPRAIEPITDEFGFVDETNGLMKFDTLLKHRAVLIVGPPWVGKSFVAGQLQTMSPPEGESILFTQLVDHSVGLSVAPAGWQDWLSSGRQTTWVIDSLDEGDVIQTNLHQHLLLLLRGLNDSAKLRLRIVMFCREAEIPDSLQHQLTALYGNDFIAAELLPLTRTEARKLLGEATFTSVLEAIKKNKLQGVAPYPRPLQFIWDNLKRPLNSVDIWRGVLKELLDDPRKTRADAVNLEERFAAAEHLACVMTLAGVDRVSRGGDDIDGHPLGEMVRESTKSGTITRAKARQALNSTMFNNGRFAQKNVREWMCAYALKDMLLTRVKGLLTDKEGQLNRTHNGVLALLQRIGSEPIRDWIFEKSGGVVLRSDHALTIDELREVLDQLEAIAETTPRSLRIWSAENFRTLNVHGIGEELAARLTDAGRSVRRRTLSLDIAYAVGAGETVEPAMEILKNSSSPDEMLEPALILVRDLATPSQLYALEDFVQTAAPLSRVQKAVVSLLIRFYLESGRWTTSEAVRHLPDDDGDVLDSTSVLYHVLTEHLDVGGARTMVELLLGSFLDSGELSRPLSRRREELVTRAVKLLLDQELPGDADLEMLIPLAIEETRQRALGLYVSFQSAFRKSAKCRRKLYVEDFRRWRDRDQRAGRRHFSWILAPEDAEWLIEQLPTLGPNDPELLDDLLVAGFRGSEALKEKTREFVKRRDPEIVTRFDRAIEANQRREEEFAAREAAMEQRRKQEEVEIRQYTADVLRHGEWSLAERMWKLSEVCFPSDHGRPRNLVGTWDDLDAAVQDAILHVCVDGLRSCDATPIPSGNGVPQTVLFEAWAFRAVVKLRRSELALNEHLIRKWLPAMLHWSIYWDMQTINECLSIDPTATEQVFAETIQRDLLSGSRQAITRKHAVSAVDTGHALDRRTTDSRRHI